MPQFGNNGVPALYFEANKENATLFGMVLYDNQYVYTYYLYKPLMMFT